MMLKRPTTTVGGFQKGSVGGEVQRQGEVRDLSASFLKQRRMVVLHARSVHGFVVSSAGLMTIRES